MIAFLVVLAAGPDLTQQRSEPLESGPPETGAEALKKLSHIDADVHIIKGQTKL